MAYQRNTAGVNNFGNFCIDPNFKHRIYTPKGTLTEFRVFPEVIQGEIQEQIFPADNPLDGISGMMTQEEHVSFLGSKKFQFFTTPTDAIEGKRSPVNFFKKRITDFVKDEGRKKFV